MRDDSDAPKPIEPVDPVEMARRDLKKGLPRRFYREVTTAPQEAGFGLELDGKPVRTPAQAALVVPNPALAEIIAEEWRAQGEWIDPDAMPTTRLVNTAIDAVAKTVDATSAAIAKFAETDLVCYRAGEPDALVAAQAKFWDPILAFARETLGARFVCAEGVMYVDQPEPARAAVRAAVDAIASGPSAHLRIAALSEMTSLTGSVLIALAVAHWMLSAEDAWSAAHVDEDVQMGIWGMDVEALARRAMRWRDMLAAANVYRLAV